MEWWIFQNLVITAALAAVVAAICRIGRAGPVIKHALWVLVLVKFVTPPLLVWPWAAPDPFGITARLGNPPVADVVLRREPLPATAESISQASPLAPVAVDATTADWSATIVADAGVWSWLLAVWVGGSLCLLAIEATRLVRIARRVRTAQPADAAITSRIAFLARRLGLPSIPAVSITGAASPAVFCLGRPVLLWPLALPLETSTACIDGLLVHELAHVKRRDHLVGWLELAAGVLWWWNPLFWYVRSSLREQAELACDAWVITALPDGRRAYAESLLALSGATAGPISSTSIAAVVGVRAGTRRLLERRLVMIMKGRTPIRLSRAALVTLGALAVATLPAWAATPQQPAPKPVPQPAPAVEATQVKPAPHPAPARATTVHPAPAPPATHAPAAQATTVARPVHAAPTAQAGTTVHIPVHTDVSQTVQVRPVMADRRLYVTTTTKLPEEGQNLLKGFEADRSAIQAEADKKVEERRAALVKALEALQDQYAKSGKLDEAVAIRDYLRAGGPGGNVRYAIRKR